MALLRPVLVTSVVALAMMFPADASANVSANVSAHGDVRGDAATAQGTHDVDAGDSLSLLALGVLVGGVAMMGVSNLRRPGEPDSGR